MPRRHRPAGHASLSVDWRVSQSPLPHVNDSTAARPEPPIQNPGIGPEHSFLFEEKRVKYAVIDDKEALKAFKLCSQLEGIIPALEPSHALAELIKIAPKRKKDEIIVMNMCGRGDKDIFTVAEYLGIKL